MWHEARKQERRIRGMIVDYRKRAERRQDFYERIQADPAQFIQVHGRRCKIYLDPTVAAAGDGAAIIVPWQGHQDNLIDRFDVRAHLDYISPVSKYNEAESVELTTEERQCNYERYRILAQNDFLNVTEEKFLHQLYLEEQFGANAQVETERNLNKKKHKAAGAAIGYSYDESDVAIGPQPFSHLMNISTRNANISKSEKGSDSDSESDIDMDVSIEVSKLDTAQAHELNSCGRNYGMIGNDFYSFLTKDADEAEALRMAREEEQEKMLLSGRKSRRERRAQKEKRIACRPFSPPSYAAKEDPTAAKTQNYDESDSRSPSPIDANTGKITYITSFGGEDELQPHSKISINIQKIVSTQGSPLSVVPHCESLTVTNKPTYAQKVKENLEKLKVVNKPSRCGVFRKRDRSRRRTSSRSHSRSRSELSIMSRKRRTHRDIKKPRYSRLSSKERFKHYKHQSRSHSRSVTPQCSRHYSYRSFSSSPSSTASRTSSARSDYNERNKRAELYRRKRASSIRSRSISPTRLPQLNIPNNEKAQNREASKASVATNSTVCHSFPLRVMGIDIPAPPPPPSTSDVSTASIQALPPPPLKRYYGRKRGDDTSSDSDTTDIGSEKLEDKIELGEDIKVDNQERMDVDFTSGQSIIYPPVPTGLSIGISQTGKYSATTANNPSFSNASEIKESNNSASAGGQNRISLRERLKRKMQHLLNKQYKADKKAEIEKTERERQLQQERDDEMRELALKLRRRQRELRHKYGTPNSSKASGSDTSDAKMADFLKSRRSVSRSIEQLSATPNNSSDAIGTSRIGVNFSGRNIETKDRRSNTRSCSRSRSRKRSPSVYRTRQKQNSTSRSRGCRTPVIRRRRSSSKYSYRRDSSCERRSSRYISERSRYDEHSACSSSPDGRLYNRNHLERCRESNREREIYRNIKRDRDYEKRRETERAKDRERERERYKEKHRERRSRYVRTFIGSDSDKIVTTSSGSRSRIVISAPPKLKKLVDY